MKRKALNAILLTLTAIMLVAMPVLAYVYRAPYTITESDGNAYDMLPVMTDNATQNQWMVDNGFMLPSANDTRIETLGGLVQPHMVTDNATLTAVAVPANSQTNLYFTTGNSESAFDIIPGYGGHITIPDNADIEPTDNFTIEQSGWIDTSYLVSSGSEIFRPTGNGTTTEFETATTNHWADVDEVIADNATTEVYFTDTNGATNSTDLFIIPNHSIGSGRITGVTVYFVWKYWRGDSPHGASAVIRTYSTTYHSPAETGSNDIWYSNNYTWASNPYTGMEWTWNEIDALEIGGCVASKYTAGSYNGHLSQVYAVVNYVTGEKFLVRKGSDFELSITASGDITASINQTDNVTATGISSGEHTIITTASPRASPSNLKMETIRPNAVGDETNHSPSAGANWECVDEAVADNATTTVAQATNPYSRDLYNMNDCSTGNDTFISSITVYANCWGEVTINQESLKIAIKSGTGTGTPDTIDEGSEETLTANWVIYSNEWATNPATSSAWTWDEIDKLQAGVSMRSTNTGGLNSSQCTQVYVQVNYDEENYIRIYIDSEEKDNAYLSGANVTDNSENWTLMQSNSMPYADNFTMTINNTQQIWFQPNSMIIGDNLPNRGSASVNGTFNWGSNPAGVNVTMGGMVSESQPAPGITVDDPTIDILPEARPSDWFVEPDVSGELLNNPIRPFVTMMSDTTTITELQAWRILALAFILLVTVATARAVKGHHFITGLACGGSIYLAVDWTIWPMWALVFVAGAIVGGIIAERAPSL